MIGVIRKVKGQRTYWVNGKEVSEKEFDRRMNAAKTSKPIARPRGMKRGYPIKSCAMAVHSTQREEAMAHDAKLGVPTEYTPGGRPILRDAAHRKAYLKAYGFHDRNSYNGY